MRDHAAGEPEGGISRVVRGGLVLLAVLVPAMRDVRRAKAAQRLHLAEEVVEHVAPVAEHVENDAAAVLLAVVPRRPLRWHVIALEHPVAELAAHGKKAAEKSIVAQLLQLEEARQPELVLYLPVLDARLLRRPVKVIRLGERGRHRLFAVHVLPGRDGALEEPRPQLGGGGVEKDSIIALERRAEVGAPALEAVLFCKRFKLPSIAADEQRVGHEARAVLERHAALLADGEDGADEVLVHAHAAADPVHDDADALLAHLTSI